MLRTSFCDLVGIDVPIVQAPTAPYTTPELVAAVSNAGGLGSYATGMRSIDQVKRDVGRIRELTSKPFAINFLMRAFDPEAFEFTLSNPPAVISFAAAAPENEIQQARAAGAIVMVQIHTVEQARQAASLGVDALVAQGTEAGGLTGTVTLMVLLPQVIDAVHPLPVIGAGGIADGRGLAAVLALGGYGVNVGTRFLASEEAAPDEHRRRELTSTRSEDTVRATIIDRVFPPPEENFPLSMRSVRTRFLNEWEGRGEIDSRQLEKLRQEIEDAARTGRMHEYAAGAGQSVGLIREILPAAEIIDRMVSEAEDALMIASAQSAPPAYGGA